MWGACLLALVQLAASLSVWRAIRAEVRVITSGQGESFVQALRDARPDVPGPPDPAVIEAILEDHADQGLRYVALVEPDGRVVVDAGTPTGGRLERDQLDGGGRPERIGDIVRMVTGPPDGPEGGPPHRGGGPHEGRPPALVVEFEPTLAQGLQVRATAALAVGVGVGVVLVAAALWLVAVLARSEAAEARAVQQRHLARMGEMSAVLAHEIRNPLAALKGHAQLLAEALPEGRPADKAARLVRETQRLEELTTALLEFARTGAVEVAATDVPALLREASGAVVGQVEVEVGEGVDTWLLDTTRMRSVLVNLLDNGLRASEAPVRLSARRSGRRLVLAVADRGPGVPADDAARIFEPFVTTRSQGTGLGLAQCRRVVELHGGEISVRDHPEGGAIFEVIIPDGRTG